MTLLPILSSSSPFSRLSPPDRAEGINSRRGTRQPNLALCCEAGETARRLFLSLPGINQWNIALTCRWLCKRCVLSLERFTTVLTCISFAVLKTTDVYEYTKRLGSEVELPEPCTENTTEQHRTDRHRHLSHPAVICRTQPCVSTQDVGEQTRAFTGCSYMLSYSTMFIHASTKPKIKHPRLFI